MSNDELKAIQERAEKATPGPWRSVRQYSNECETCPHIYAGDKWVAVVTGAPYLGFKQTLPDADFIAHARTDIPTLLADLKEADMLLWELVAWSLRQDDTITAMTNLSILTNKASSYLEQRLRSGFGSKASSLAGQVADPNRGRVVRDWFRDNGFELIRIGSECWLSPEVHNAIFDAVIAKWLGASTATKEDTP